MSKILIRLFLLFCLPVACFSQDLNWDVNLAKPKTFVSLNPEDDPGVTVAQMWKVSMKSLMNLVPQKDAVNYGIFGDLYDLEKGNIKVSVYLYDSSHIDPDAPGFNRGRGPLIFQCYQDRTNNGDGVAEKANKYELGEWLAWWPDASETDGGFYFNDHWISKDTRSAIMAAAFYDYNKKFTGWNSTGNPGTAVIPYSSLTQPGEDFMLPVIIELTVYKANVKYISLPGIGTLEADYFRPPYLDIQCAITRAENSKVRIKLAISDPPTGVGVTPSIGIAISRIGDTIPIYSKRIESHQLPYSAIDSLRVPSLEDGGEYWVWANYGLSIPDGHGGIHDYPNQIQFLASFMANGGSPAQRVYDIAKLTYHDLPVYKLSGGMSAEYGVEKSLASLSSGTSETWDVRTVNGVPDLKDGGPVSVYPDVNKFDFLDQAVKKTVQLYNDNLGAITKINTVIFGTGVANVPYLSNAMKAPFLPLHFLVSVHSVAEVQRILATAKAGGYSAFSMMGYDPSVNDIGVAWVKLRELPTPYVKFLIDHKVQNVIIMGYQEGVAGGEGGARRIWIEGAPDEDYAEGSMYMMAHGEEKTYKGFYKDYYRWNFDEEKTLVDWEGGITNNQIQNISGLLKSGGINTYTIQAGESFNFYQWALDVQLQLLKRNKQIPEKISMNEYLIGFPEYELYTNTLPYLYWQGLHPGQIAFNTYDFSEFKLHSFYPGKFKDIPVYIQAKANRKPILDSLKGYFTNVTMGSWQKADVWDTTDGMNSPCELVAKAITDKPNGAKAFADWNNKRAVLDFDDLRAMMNNSVKPPPSANPQLFPKPTRVEELKRIDEAALNISRYLYDPNTYWQPPNFPNNIEMRSMTSGYPGTVMGYLDGQLRPHDVRKQSITISRFRMVNRNDEYDLRMGYKFNVHEQEGLLSYDPALGEEQKMDCFEFTSIPYNHWFDIPSRMMARSGAVWIVNGAVYDFDYNGLPGVVPFIKKNGDIKAQPQILSFKGEGVFAWDWGVSKRGVIISRPRAIPGTGLPAAMSALFRDQTKDYPNVIGGMTYMSGAGLYDITALQPDWMKNYPAFPPYYLTADRCFFAPLSLKCGGTEIVAPIDDGWNDCSKLQTDEAVQRFSALAYRQYQRTFDDVPNARTYIGIKGDTLDIGIIDGDYGQGGYRGRIATKSLGMHVYEESQFRLAQGYNQFVNLDGGSSSQMWVNGQGPLQMLNSYVLKTDNQGPYYSRLVSLFIMLVPKLHTELIRQKVMQADPGSVPIFDNSNIHFSYSDNTDLNKSKAFIDLSPSKDSLNRTDGSYGLIAGNFYTSNPGNIKNGGILFYIGEDMFYPETKGIYTVVPRLRNLMVVGIGMVLPSLVDTLLKLKTSGTSGEEFKSYVGSTSMSAYYIKVYNGVITDFIFEMDPKLGRYKYLSGDHRFMISSDGPEGELPSGQNIFFKIDGEDISLLENSASYYSNAATGFLNIGECTHAYIGAVNLDGRFLTGDMKMKTYNYLFAAGKDAWKVVGNTEKIDLALQLHTLPNMGDLYYKPGIYAVQCLETSGQHVFALAPAGVNRFYGLRLNNFIFKKKTK